jgi:hypothetical protein
MKTSDSILQVELCSELLYFNDILIRFYTNIRRRTFKAEKVTRKVSGGTMTSTLIFINYLANLFIYLLITYLTTLPAYLNLLYIHSIMNNKL